MHPSAFSAAPPASSRRGWQRLAVLAAGAVTAAAALVAIAAPATAGSASPVALVDSYGGASQLAGNANNSNQAIQDCGGGGGWIGSGNRTCVESAVTPTQETSASTQDCRGPFSGSGGVTSCQGLAVTSAQGPGLGDILQPCGPLSTYCPVPEPDVAPALTTNAFVQNCDGGTASTSGGRACVAPATSPAHATVQTFDEGAGLKGGGAKGGGA